ncbi:ABC transporter permease [Synergistales bacterium]|nr:ABC transporter permease [Synergistales bacterium]
MNNLKRSAILGHYAWGAFLLCAIFFFFVYPLVRLFFLSFQGKEGLTLSLYWNMLASARVQKGILNTIGIVAFSSLLSVTVGVFEAWLLAYTDIRGKSLLRALFLVPFVIPSYITSLAWSRMMGDSGFLSQILQSVLPPGFAVPTIYGWWGIVWVMGICNAPLAFMFCLSAMRKIPRELEWAARCSGCGPWETFFSVTLPQALPGIAGGALTVALAGIDNFGIPAFLGANKGVNVLSTLIYQEVMGFGPSAFGRAACLSVILGLLALLCCFVLWRLLGKSESLESMVPDMRSRVSLGKARWKVELFIWVFIVVTSLMPLVSMLAVSLVKAYGLRFVPGNITLDHFSFLFQNRKAVMALLNSFKLSLFTGFVALVIGSAAAYVRIRRPGNISRFIEAAFTLPYVLPGTVFALSMIITWIEPIPGWRPGIYGTATLLGMVYVVRFSALQLRATASALQQLDRSVEEAAATSGAGRAARWASIIIPLVATGLFSGFFMTAAHAFTELTVSSILGSVGSETIGMVVLNFEQSGNITVSCAFSVLALLLMGVFLIPGAILHRRNSIRG